MRFLATVLFAVLLSGGAFTPALHHEARAAETGKAARPAALKPVLRAGITVQGRIVRLGDLFENTGEKARIPVAYAPEPGRTSILDADRLYEIAYANNLAWRPSGPFERIIVTRASQTIDGATIVNEVRAKLKEQGLDDELWVTLDYRNLTVHLPTNVAATIALKDFRFDKRTRRFTATLLAPADTPLVMRGISGLVDKVATIPVLKRRIAANQVIRESDIERFRVRERSLRVDTVTDPREVVGMAPRRLLRPGRMIRRSDLRRPVLIPKGSMVTMRFKTRLMTLTSRGKALEDGAKGATIKVMNLRSKKPVDARVIGPGLVMVSSSIRVSLAR